MVAEVLIFVVLGFHLVFTPQNILLRLQETVSCFSFCGFICGEKESNFFFFLQCIFICGTVLYSFLFKFTFTITSKYTSQALALRSLQYIQLKVGNISWKKSWNQKHLLLLLPKYIFSGKVSTFFFVVSNFFFGNTQ